jgi:hypothetical protein|tara:strand:- start:18369 stop:18560 length:192 start_codon:yes stop_codon:yes gene_type:complete
VSDEIDLHNEYEIAFVELLRLEKGTPEYKDKQLEAAMIKMAMRARIDPEYRAKLLKDIESVEG